MSRVDVQELVFSDHRIALRVAEQLSARIADLEDRLTDLTCKLLGERLAATLCQLARDAADEPIRLTHQQLGALVGATRERTTIALGDLARHHLISLRRGKIIIEDKHRLAALADSAHLPMSSSVNPTERG